MNTNAGHFTYSHHENGMEKLVVHKEILTQICCSKWVLNKMMKLTSFDPCLKVHSQLFNDGNVFLYEQSLYSTTMGLQKKLPTCILKCGTQRNGLILELMAVAERHCMYIKNKACRVS